MVTLCFYHRNEPLAGHTFPVNKEALRELKVETARVRLGVRDVDVGEMYGEDRESTSDDGGD
jgi:hypothetical protein